MGSEVGISNDRGGGGRFEAVRATAGASPSPGTGSADGSRGGGVRVIAGLVCVRDTK